MSNLGLHYNLNEKTKELRKAKADCEARLTAALVSNDEVCINIFTQKYYNILLEMDKQRKDAVAAKYIRWKEWKVANECQKKEMN